MRPDSDALYVESDLVEIKVSMGSSVVGVFWVYTSPSMVGKSKVSANVGTSLVLGVKARCVLLVSMTVCSP